MLVPRPTDQYRKPTECEALQKNWQGLFFFFLPVISFRRLGSHRYPHRAGLHKKQNFVPEVDFDCLTFGSLGWVL